MWKTSDLTRSPSTRISALREDIDDEKLMGHSLSVQRLPPFMGWRELLGGVSSGVTHVLGPITFDERRSHIGSVGEHAHHLENQQEAKDFSKTALTFSIKVYRRG